MKESAFNVTINGEILYGIVGRSELPAASQQTTVILLHGWAGYRTGPHDMLVKLSRRLYKEGYDCFRFDFRGKGYSQGNFRKTTINHTMREDLEAIVRYAQDSFPQNELVLIGICSGAKLALSYARNGKYPVKHVIELSSPVLRQREVASDLATQQSKQTVQTYLLKAFRKETWLKFIDGEIHFHSVWKNILRPFSIFLALRRKKREKIKARSTNPVIASNIQPFGKLQGRLLLIHGEKDPETKSALAQVHEMMQRYHVSAETYIVKGANHSFYSLTWEREIIEKIANWLSGNRNPQKLHS